MQAQNRKPLRHLNEMTKKKHPQKKRNTPFKKNTWADFELTKSVQPRPKGNKKPVKKKAPTLRELPSSTNKSNKTSKNGLSQFLTTKNIQESLKTVTNLRGMVKNWMQYLQQADQILDTLHTTSSSLKETGILDKLIKQRGKNLTTEDFTNILITLMNSPIGAQMLKGSGNTSEEPTAEPPTTK